ncbi:hypothetical protein Nepgr_012114 [Nepenthes gracilis]|uniref:DUF538 domain-containing protein n=1 Tax=Nepenthes gracilis TaxID=150966 RepID=A0AAD3XMQ4_NEPGR|nr:hypothetical protein Nepgr_012114 [Nepenthes gracilis]
MALPQHLVYSISLCVFCLVALSYFPAIISNPIRPYEAVNSIPDVHDILPKFNLPKGIVPNCVKSYTLSENGDFTIELEQTCYVKFEDQLVYYDKRIRGNLSIGSVSDVSGIQAKKLFIWVSVTGMDMDLDSMMVEFHVGALSEKLPAGLFETVPNCMKKASF